MIELTYGSRVPAPRLHTTCPHCGAKIEGGARRMFNWVELDQSPPSDARALLLPALGGLLLIPAIAALTYAPFA